MKATPKKISKSELGFAFPYGVILDSLEPKNGLARQILVHNPNNKFSQNLL
jgi:hypothetical protein